MASNSEPSDGRRELRSSTATLAEEYTDRMLSRVEETI